VADAALARPTEFVAGLPASERPASPLGRLGTALAAALAVAGTAAASGAYFPTSWGWAAIAFGWTGVLALLMRERTGLSTLEMVTLAGLAAVTGWTALSATWSLEAGKTFLEFERALVYLTGGFAAILLVRRSTVPYLLGGVLAAITGISTYAVGTRLLPERLGSVGYLLENRLSAPLGYWNALGILAAMGVLIGLGFAARSRSVLGRALAAAALPILVTTLYFTFGRGGWIALGLGLLVTLAIDNRRLQLITVLLAVAPATAAAVWIASGSKALTTTGPPLSEATRQGHHFAPILLALVVAAAASSLVVAWAERRLPPMPRGRILYGIAVWFVFIVLVAAGLARYGSPWTIADRVWRDFKAPPIAFAPGQNLNRRLFKLSGRGRIDLWRAAWHDTEAHPLLGSGAGTYETYWFQHRPTGLIVRDAHSLYLETLAELGSVGLALLFVLLGAPIIAGCRARRYPLVSAVLGAYVAYLIHAAGDWDWEVPAVTLTALLAGVCLLRAADTPSERVASLTLRISLGVILIAAAAFSLVGLVGNRAVAASGGAAAQQHWGKAEADAQRAIDWAPWSPDGWRRLGEAQLQQADAVDARASFRHALAIDRHDWTLWFDLALASHGLQRREAVKAALKLNPLSPEIYYARRALGIVPEH